MGKKNRLQCQLVPVRRGALSENVPLHATGRAAEKVPLRATWWPCVLETAKGSNHMMLMAHDRKEE